MVATSLGFALHCFALLLILEGIRGQECTSPFPPDDACGCIVAANSDNHENYMFKASDAFNCLTSVPFHADVATQFLKYWKDTLQFQSTLSYLKDPPLTYRQPAVDLLGGIDLIQQGVDTGTYNNEYDFEAALQRLILDAHDGNLYLTAGALAAFSFAAPPNRYIVSVSKDGVSPPQVYLLDDILAAQNNVSLEIFPIITINGRETLAFLEEFAYNNSVGMVEPHADWNQLMSSPVLDAQASYSIWEGYTTFYPGDELNMTFSNGRYTTDQWRAIYYSPGKTGPLWTGGDFYNFFVLGLYPASYDSTLDSASKREIGDTVSEEDRTRKSKRVGSTTCNGWNCEPGESNIWPHPDVSQSDVSVLGGDWLTGYYLDDYSTMVISIPTFDVYGQDVDDFSSSITKFINAGKSHGMTRLIVDVQQASGSNYFLAIDTFKRFFPSPNITFFTGSRARAQPYADILGRSYSDYWKTLHNTTTEYESYYADEWVAFNRLNAANGLKFTSWEEYFGPDIVNGDNFTNVQEYNLNDPIFDAESLQGSKTQAVYGYAGNIASPSNAIYAATDMLLLSDGLCSGACALFVELMHHYTKVPIVVAGGRPDKSPMQAPSGSRGAELYGVEELDSAVYSLQNPIKDGPPGLGPDLLNALPSRYGNIYITSAGINLRDQLRRDETTPLQFLYGAADCRIYYTKHTVYNMGNLWRYTADAWWKNQTLCIATADESQHLMPVQRRKKDLGLTDPAMHMGDAGLAFRSDETFDLLNDTAASLIPPKEDMTTPNWNSQPRASYYNSGTTNKIGIKCQKPQGIQAAQSNCGEPGLICIEVNTCANPEYVCALQCTASTGGPNSQCGGVGSCQANLRVTRDYYLGYCPDVRIDSTCGWEDDNDPPCPDCPARKT